jgi:phage terminase large subunit-like protein
MDPQAARSLPLRGRSSNFRCVDWLVWGRRPDILYLIGIVRMQVELPDVREAIIAHDSLDKPAIIVMHGNGIGRGPYQDLWARGFRHLLPRESMASSASDNLKIRRFSEGLFSLYDGLVRLPNAMPGRGLETLLAEIAAFPDGKHDDQVDALSYVAAYCAKVIYEARRWGLKLGRVEVAAGQSSGHPTQITRSGALRPATMASGLTRSQQSDVHEQILPVLVASPAASTSIHLMARRPLRRRRAELEESNRGQGVDRDREGAGRGQAARIAGQERISSRSPSARDAHRFESPQLHQEVRAN